MSYLLNCTQVSAISGPPNPVRSPCAGPTTVLDSLSSLHLMPPYTHYSDHRNLTTTVINRLLRPLRSRCNGLAKLPNATPATAPATYSSSNRVGLLEINQNHDPLAVLPPPDKLASHLYFSQEYKGFLELARRVYALRDAFKNIVVRAGLSGPTPNHASLPTRIVPLSALCAQIIGQNLQDWEEPSDGSDSDVEERESLYSARISYADEMYEAVPISYRG